MDLEHKRQPPPDTQAVRRGQTPDPCGRGPYDELTGAIAAMVQSRRTHHGPISAHKPAEKESA